ncbi:hypothetical protein PV05_03049 [Exophiala xenobiotica]|uniref:Uncharacterized protein n=1 Tax=Exophiala xenobiotica TaxID=348802 RepID=A0A0D2FEN3_9EURO|nr:uncharacterized protein PV05_03049 [Exophiala xenobiotica]KIW58539.1 hypothetical protein PV05_03049 [Exophiala xenobiotica]
MATRGKTLSICHSCLRNALRSRQVAFAPLSRSSRTLIRAASSTSTSQNPNKPIVLEQPDKFRPPSHPARLTSRRRAPAAYNQGTTAEEKESQKTRTYPHMFPQKGSFMHWFLTDRWIHIWITMGTLTLLAVITLTQTFLKTSPYAHLLPPVSSLPFHPISYVRESLSVIKLHIDYTTAQANESRQQKILDAQKRRLYRRAHGMEDLNAAEEQGIDVRGLVPWDDGLTNAERERGGREEVLTGRDVVAMGGQVGDDVNEFARRLKERREKGEEGEEIEQVQREPPKKRKLWLGIW